MATNKPRTHTSLDTRLRGMAASLRPRLMDRYVLTGFLVPFSYCLFGFIGIWLAWDVGQNGLELLDMNVAPAQIAAYYATLLPSLFVTILPIALLLALLYSLTRMSRRNEIISFLMAGVSLPRILAPLLLASLLLTFISGWLHAELAPQAERTAREYMARLRDDQKRFSRLEAHVFRNRGSHRIWFIQRVPLQGEQMFRGVQVIVQTPDAGGIPRTTAKYYANLARYDRFESAWEFRGARFIAYDENGAVKSEDKDPRLYIRGWSETPEQIVSASMREDDMSIPQLREHLRHNETFTPAQLAPFRTQLHWRHAAAWICMISTLIGASLAVVFNRRGMLPSIATAIALFFLLWIGSQIFLALGKGGRIPAWPAAWIPLIIFGAVGLWLLWMRSNNRELPSPGVGLPRAVRLPK